MAGRMEGDCGNGSVWTGWIGVGNGDWRAQLSEGEVKCPISTKKTSRAIYQEKKRMRDTMP